MFVISIVVATYNNYWNNDHYRIIVLKVDDISIKAATMLSNHYGSFCRRWETLPLYGYTKVSKNIDFF